jgi:hypothetical protein
MVGGSARVLIVIQRAAKNVNLIEHELVLRCYAAAGAWPEMYCDYNYSRSAICF